MPQMVIILEIQRRFGEQQLTDIVQPTIITKRNTGLTQLIQKQHLKESKAFL